MSSTSHTNALKLPAVGTRLQDGTIWAEVFAHAQLPTRFGHFHIVVFRNSLDPHEHVALVHGSVFEKSQVLCRVHSECLTGDAFGSLRCDCRDQLEMSMQALHQAPEGVLLYMRQEGRGIGLGQKIRAYTLQEQGMDTLQANEHLGFLADARDYRVAALMLRILQVRSVALATNNPKKIESLKNLGIDVCKRQPIIAQANPHNKHYLETKAQKAGHLLPLFNKPHS